MWPYTLHAVSYEFIPFLLFISKILFVIMKWFKGIYTTFLATKVSKLTMNMIVSHWSSNTVTLCFNNLMGLEKKACRRNAFISIARERNRCRNGYWLWQVNRLDCGFWREEEIMMWVRGKKLIIEWYHKLWLISL